MLIGKVRNENAHNSLTAYRRQLTADPTGAELRVEDAGKCVNENDFIRYLPSDYSALTTDNACSTFGCLFQKQNSESLVEHIY